MAETQLQQKLAKAIRNSDPGKHNPPWGHLPRQTAYNANLHQYALRKNTMPTTVRLYGPYIEAASYYGRTENTYQAPVPFMMVQKRTTKGYEWFVEAGMPDGTSFLVVARNQELRVSLINDDLSRDACFPFADLNPDALSMIVMSLLPQILQIDAADGGSKIGNAVKELCSQMEAADKAGQVWNDKNDIPDGFRDAAYFLDAVTVLMKERITLDCGDDTSDAPAEVEAHYFSTNSVLSGAFVCGTDNGTSWEPKLVRANGKAKKDMSNTITIAEAKAMFAGFSDHRNWTPQEKMLIPSFDDDMPVMAETIRMAKRIVDSKKDVNPVCNLMWRGVTAYGKSTGVKQLACILNRPLLTQTCHPNMEAQDFKSQFVPDSKTDGILLDMDNLSCSTAHYEAQNAEPPMLAEACAYLKGLSEAARTAVLDARVFFTLALMDPDTACQQLLGKPLGADMDAESLVWLYSEVSSKLRSEKMMARIALLEAVNEQKEDSKDNDHSAPQFVHVVSPYLKAMVNGYIVEIQEASRIRDSGVMVSINEFDRPGALFPLMNGYTARRHEDALCIITDNVGYASCRPIDPSVLRRQALIIDSYELEESVLKDRVKRNTGVTDDKTIDMAYSLWSKVKEFCEQNSITEGSVSPMELERFVQAIKYDGIDSIAYNLDDCIISKATSSIDDQRDIRTACETILNLIA